MRRFGALALVCAVASTIVVSPTSRAAASDLSHHAPVFQSLTLTPSSPFTGDMLRTDALAFEPDVTASGTPITYSYEWSRNGAVLVGETGPTLDLSTIGNGDTGDTISVRVTASDGDLTTDASTSVVVADGAPTVDVSLASTGPAMNAVVPAPGLAGDSDTQREGDHGDGVVVDLVASDGTLDSAVASADATVVNSAPTVAVSLDTTTPTTKSVVMATVLGKDLDNDGLTYVYVWRLNGVVKRTITTTAMADRYDLAVRGNGNEGELVTVTVTATDGSLASPDASVSATIHNPEPLP